MKITSFAEKFKHRKWHNGLKMGVLTIQAIIRMYVRLSSVVTATMKELAFLKKSTIAVKEIASVTISENPFSPLNFWFVVGRIGGLPIKLSEEGIDQVKWPYFAPIVTIFGLTMLWLLDFFMSVNGNGVTPEKHLEIEKQLGYSVTDLASSLAYLLPQIYILMKSSIDFKSASTDFDCWAKMFQSIGCKEGIAKSGKKAKIVGSVILFFSFISSLGFAYKGHLTNQWFITQNTSVFASFIHIFDHWVTFFFLNAPVVTILGHIMALYILDLTANTLENFNTNMNEELHTVLRNGYQIVALLKHTEKCLGTLIMTEICHCLVCQIFGFFFTISHLFQIASMSGTNQFYILVNALVYVIVCGVATGRMFALFSKGQVLKDIIKRVINGFSEIELRRGWLLSSEERVKLRVLVSKFRDFSSLRPGDTFDLNRSTAVGFLGMTLTYVAILLQFKIGEL